MTYFFSLTELLLHFVEYINTDVKVMLVVLVPTLNCLHTYSNSELYMSERGLGLDLDIWIFGSERFFVRHFFAHSFLERLSLNLLERAKTWIGLYS